MLTGRKASLFFLLLLLVFCGYSLVKLFLIRFETGDVLPAYSSLRTDPLGTKAFFDSLGELGYLRVERNFSALSRLGEDEAAVFFLGAGRSYSGAGSKRLAEFDRLAAGGCRVVICFYPLNPDRKPEKPAPPAERPMNEAEAKKETEKESPDRDPGLWWFGSSNLFFALAEHWDLDPNLEKKADGHVKRQALAAGLPGLPRKAAWHSGLYFSPRNPAWRVIYRVDGRPVVLERSFGRGSIVFCSDSFFLSNESLRLEPASGLLAWLVGEHQTIVFDETHLGVGDNPGVAALARKYKLGRLLLILTVLAGLFVWRGSFSLAPPPDETGAEENKAAAGQDSAAGLISLLRRNLDPADLPRACLKEWREAFTHRREDLQARAEEAEKLLESGRRSSDEAVVLDLYRKVKQKLNKGMKTWRTTPGS